MRVRHRAGENHPWGTRSGDERFRERSGWEKDAFVLTPGDAVKLPHHDRIDLAVEDCS